MNPWSQAACVVGVAVCGVLLARTLSRRPKAWWIGYALPLALLALLTIGRLSWITTAAVLHRIAVSQWRYPLLALAISLGLWTCVPRLRFVWQRRLLIGMIGAFVLWFCVVPFVTAAVLASDLSRLPNRFDAHGICRQSRSYTCGPAAAVTALRVLGLPADEGRLARLSRSTPFSGTLPQTLAHVLQTYYEDQGLQCRYEPVATIDQLEDDAVALTILHEGLLADHCVAVLDVTDDVVVLGDPAQGRRTIDRTHFERLWRGWAIRLRRL